MNKNKYEHVKSAKRKEELIYSSERRKAANHVTREPYTELNYLTDM